MGEVYLAEHPRLPRHDALKTLAADAAELLRTKYRTGMLPDEVVETVAAIADALDYAHDRAPSGAPGGLVWQTDTG
jgi:hypothetical protein